MLFLFQNIMEKQIQIETFDTSNQAWYDVALAIRRKVFIQGQNVDPLLEIENEEACTHYLLIIDDQAIGTGRWRKTNKGIKLERFAILEEFRNNGYGTVLLKKILNDIQSLQEKIYLHAQIQAVNYYKREGFISTGEVFSEAGIDHYLMVKKNR